jgi:hypothetical protein
MKGMNEMEDLFSRFSTLKKEEKISFLDDLTTNLLNFFEIEGIENFMPRLVSFVKTIDPHTFLYFMQRCVSIGKLNDILGDSDDLFALLKNTSKKVNRGVVPSCFPTKEEFFIIKNGNPHFTHLDINKNCDITFRGINSKEVFIRSYFGDNFCVLYPYCQKEDLEIAEQCMSTISEFMRNKMEKPEIRLEYVTSRYYIFISHLNLY